MTLAEAVRAARAALGPALGVRAEEVARKPAGWEVTLSHVAPSGRRYVTYTVYDEPRKVVVGRQ